MQTPQRTVKLREIGGCLMQIRMSDPAQYQQIVDAEWNIIYDKLAKCADSGARIVLSRLAIGDLGTQYFADRDIFCAGRVRCLTFSRTHLRQQCPCHAQAAYWACSVPSKPHIEHTMLCCERVVLEPALCRRCLCTVHLGGLARQFCRHADVKIVGCADRHG